MSFAASKKNYYLINAPDISNSQRAKHTPQHMENSMPLVRSGYIVAAGVFLPAGINSSDADAVNKASGSYVIVQADTVEQAWATLKEDVFWTSGEVWDHDKLTVTPVYVAVPKVE
ncbi:hypothetical protein L226DRAFT_537289 [Lentinus tigrinus ALCF2SS1-7]|uniref:YCII-related domain-containing protein n=1 Tax=Lentinus tigrinus ALCF2SS1-6 TaxID=1328759 RepID=A0A5C2S3G7_9APHY|nr:hypothetical protein L227DRAFT_505714 [Lentinus tigrinus ALCF2SS1-6]RPD72159.1 hypothetical protein L226DRAFT_537289 [Lentinus tigrinus ALCF2SS1-7]